MRQYDSAIEHLQRVVRRDPTFWRAYINLAWCLLATRRVTEAMTMVETATALNPAYPTMIPVRAHAYAAAADRAPARPLLPSALAGPHYASRYFVALAAAALGDQDRAFQALADAVEQREWFVIFLNHEPALDQLRHDQQFVKLIERVGLPPVTK